MEDVSNVLNYIETSSLLAKIAGILATLGVVDTIFRKIPKLRSILVYVAKGIGVAEKIIMLASKAVGLLKVGVFWINDRIGKVIVDVRPPLPASSPETSAPQVPPVVP